MQISPEKLAQALYERGLSNEEIYNFIAIVRGESGFTAQATNFKGADDSWGLFQINFTKNAGGEDRAKKLGIPTKANGLPTKAGLAKYFGLKRNSDGSYSVAKGVSEDELITKNLDALEAMWNRKDYGAWSVHPDNANFTKDSGEITAEIKKERWEQNINFTDEVLMDEYGEFAFQFDNSPDASDQPENSWNIGQNTPTQEELEATGPSARELELEDEFLANKGNPERQEEILKEIIEERNRGKEEENVEELVDGVPEPAETVSPEYTNDYEFLRGNPDGDVEFEGEIWNINDLIEAEERGDLPFSFEDNDPKLGQWILGLYRQTQHFLDSEMGRGVRENDWEISGDGDEWTNRRRDLIEDTLTRVERIFGEAGIVANEVEILEFARDAWLAGWSDDAIKDVVSERDDISFGPDVPTESEINSTQQEVRSLYRQYLVDPDPDVIADTTRRIWRGETSVDAIEAGIASEAADLYPGFADRIEAGRTPLAILGSYNTIFNRVMGYMPQWDGTHQELGMQLGSGDGFMTGANFATYLRSTEEYDMTPNAINSAYNLVGTIGRTMGVMP